MKIAVISLINIIPLNSGGKMGSFYLINNIAKKFDVDFYYFEKINDQKGIIPKINFKINSLKSNINLLLPSFLKKMHFEFLFSKKTLKKIKCDIVYLDFPYLYHIAKIVSTKNKNTPIILVEHNVEWQYYKQNNFKLWYVIKLWEEFVVKKVVAVICVSKKDYKYWKNKHPNKKIYFIEHGVIDEIFNPYGKTFKFQNNKFNLLFYGKLDIEQNIWALRFIKSKLIPLLDKETIVNIFGSGKVKEELISDKKIKYYGLVENPAEYIRGADLVIVPLNNSAGVKMRILESLYCGKVVLTTPQGAEGLPNELKDLVIVCNNEKEFIEKINYFKINKSRLSKKEIIKKINEYREKSREKILKIFELVI